MSKKNNRRRRKKNTTSIHDQEKKKEQRKDDNVDNSNTTSSSPKETVSTRKESSAILKEEDAYTAEFEDDSSSSSSSSDDSSSSEEELALDGIIQRLKGHESSSDEEELSSEEEEEEGPPKKKTKKQQQQQPNANPEYVDEIIQAEFTFCDMNEKFFHGIKTYLSNNPIHAPHSSELSDLIIENISVGTVISTEGDEEDESNVFGFASILNFKTNSSSSCLQSIQQLCFQHCPPHDKTELTDLLSRKIVGCLVHDRMVNLPLDLTLTLHEQLVLDMNWAVKESEEDEFDILIRLAPCTNSDSMILYKHFEDEVFASNAKFVYEFHVPMKGSGDRKKEEEDQCAVIVMTKMGYHESLKEVKSMVRG